MPPPDEDAFRRQRDAALGHACPFERALLARCAACGLARSVLLAEREAIGCQSQAASERCHAYHDALRTASRFALRADASAPWPFSKEIRLQCGGLIGLRQALDEADGAGSADPAAPVDDADAVLQRALQRWGGLEALPYSRVIRAVIRHEPRRRAPR
ncbi:MAG: hypothetical protein KF786_13260 [Burkholderiaceae bacterium]|jgi:hypothetical protein|nr:hypothetical protein [Burkholderiaceae bacterium]